MDPKLLTDSQLIYMLTKLGAIYEAFANADVSDAIVDKSESDIRPYINERDLRLCVNPNFKVKMDNFVEEFIILEN